MSPMPPRRSNRGWGRPCWTPTAKLAAQGGLAPAWGRGCGAAVSPDTLPGQFELPSGPMGPPTLFTIPVLRYMKTYGLTHAQLAMVSVVQREWAAKNPPATFKAPITVE